MRKISWIFFAAAILMASSAIAGSIQDLDYNDRVLWMDLPRQVDDNNVVIDADRLNGLTRQQIEIDYNGKFHSVAEYSQSLGQIIQDNNESWYNLDEGFSGFRKNSLGYWFAHDWTFFNKWDSIMSYLLEYFPTHAHLSMWVNHLSERADLAQATAMTDDPAEIPELADKIKAARLGYGGSIVCSDAGKCAHILRDPGY